MKTIPVCLIVAGLLLPVVCLAEPGAPQEDSGRGGPDKRGSAGRFMDFWKSVDKNQDGFLTKEEFDGMPRIMNLPEEKRVSLFERLDKDSDGRLGRDELVKMGGKPHDRNEPPMQRLWELDLDKSGGISMEEFKEGMLFKKLPADRQVALFERLDTNRDGTITPQDKPEPPYKRDGEGPDMRRPDRPDRPGRPEGGRPDGNRMDPRQGARQLDKDGDGNLSFEEFRSGPAVMNLTEDEQEDRFEAMDKNQDLKLSPDELPIPGSRGEGKRPTGPPPEKN